MHDIEFECAAQCRRRSCSEAAKLSGRPVLPLLQPVVSLLACCSLLNGFFGEGETRRMHIGFSEGLDEVHRREANRGRDNRWQAGGSQPPADPGVWRWQYCRAKGDRGRQSRQVTRGSKLLQFWFKSRATEAVFVIMLTTQ